VQATDQYVGALGARIVLVDDTEVRAAMTASWLRQMGFADVFIFAETGAETGRPKAPTLDSGVPSQAVGVDSAALQDLSSRNGATVIDLSLSRNYLAGHIPGAWFAIRTRLVHALKKIPLNATLVLTSEDGALAHLAVREAEALTDRPVCFLDGGNAAWRAGGHSFSAEAKMADEAVDQWRKPYERSGDAKAAMQEYLAWETDLLPRIERDGSLKFFSSGG
jgi:rhodanese-related sulfurtransferase